MQTSLSGNCRLIHLHSYKHTHLFLQIAIVLEAFIEAQAVYKMCDVELTIFEDIYISLKIKMRELWEGWPSKRKIAFMLENEIASRNVAWWQVSLKC